MWPSELVDFFEFSQNDVKLCWSMMLFSFSHDFPSVRRRAAYDLVQHSHWWECCEHEVHDALADSVVRSYPCLIETHTGSYNAWDKARPEALTLPPCDALLHSDSIFPEEYHRRMYGAEAGLYEKYRMDPLQGWQASSDTTWGGG